MSIYLCLLFIYPSLSLYVSLFLYLCLSVSKGVYEYLYLGVIGALISGNWIFIFLTLICLDFTVYQFYIFKKDEAFVLWYIKFV